MRIAAIATLLIAGIFAGAQLGKIAPLVEWYQAEVGFSLVLIGWLTSMIGIFVALAALPVGWAIETVGARRSVLVGSLFLAAGALALTVLSSPAAILAARLVEGVGYVILVIALPAALTAVSLPAWRAPVLAIWSCFVPVGFALSDLIGRAMLPADDPSAYLLVMALGYVVFAGIGMLLLAGVADAGEGQGGTATIENDASLPTSAARNALAVSLGLPVMLIALSFGFYVVQSVSFFSFMPAYVAGGGVLVLSAGVIAFAAPVGNILASVLVKGASLRRAMAIAIAAMALALLAAYPIFVGSDPWVATVCALLLCFAGGIVGSVLFAILPELVGPRGSVSVAIGLVAQAGGLGTLFGPPVAGWVIERLGWQAFGLFLAATAVLSILSLLPVVRSRPAAA